MTRMTGPDCVVMCNLINTYIHTYIRTYVHTYIHTSLTSRLAPCARRTVDVPTRALWLAGIFLRRKKRCAGVVGTRTDWVLKGEEGGMTTPLLQYVARFDGGGEIFGFGGGGYKESWPWCSLFVGFPSLCCAKRRETSFTVPAESGRSGERSRSCVHAHF